MRLLTRMTEGQPPCHQPHSLHPQADPRHSQQLAQNFPRILIPFRMTPVAYCANQGTVAWRPNSK